MALSRSTMILEAYLGAVYVELPPTRDEMVMQSRATAEVTGVVTSRMEITSRSDAQQTSAAVSRAVFRGHSKGTAQETATVATRWSFTSHSTGHDEAGAKSRGSWGLEATTAEIVITRVADRLAMAATARGGLAPVGYAISRMTLDSETYVTIETTVRAGLALGDHSTGDHGHTSIAHSTMVIEARSAADAVAHALARASWALSARSSADAEITGAARSAAYFRSWADGWDEAFALSSIDQEVPLENTSVWTTDMLSWGMSRYVGLEVHDFVGTQYGVSPKGVFTTNPLEAPMSYLETGVMPLQLEEEPVRERKHINYVYTYAVHDRPMTVAVTADYRKQRLTTLYTAALPQDTDNTRAVRTAVGRGYNSNYIKLRIGAPAVFDIDQVEVEATISGRRV